MPEIPKICGHDTGVHCAAILWLASVLGWKSTGSLGLPALFSLPSWHAWGPILRTPVAEIPGVPEASIVPAWISPFGIPRACVHTPVWSQAWITYQQTGSPSPMTTQDPALPACRDVPWRFPRGHICKQGTHHLLPHRIKKAGQQATCISHNEADQDLSQHNWSDSMGDVYLYLKKPLIAP